MTYLTMSELPQFYADVSTINPKSSHSTHDWKEDIGEYTSTAEGQQDIAPDAEVDKIEQGNTGDVDGTENREPVDDDHQTLDIAKTSSAKMGERQPLLESGRHSTNSNDSEEIDYEERHGSVGSAAKISMERHGTVGFRTNSSMERHDFTGSRPGSVAKYSRIYGPRPGSLPERDSLKGSRPGSVIERHSVISSRPGSVTSNSINDHDSDSDGLENYHEFNSRTDVSRTITVSQTQTPVETGVYKRRWYVLLMLSLCVTLQNASWGTWGPIAESAKLVYGWDTTMIFILINCGNVGVLLPALFTGHMISTKGLRFSMIVCSFLLALGTGLRTITRQQTPGTILIGFGQFCCGLAGSVTQVIPAALSETWFPVNERTTATAIGVISNCAGGIVAFMLGPHIVDEPSQQADNTSSVLNGSNTNITDTEEEDRISHQIWILTIIEFGVGAALFLLVMAYFPAKPPKPPSISATKERTDFRKGLCTVFKQPIVILAAMSCALPWAVCGNWLGLLSVNFHDIGISQTQSGWFGFYASAAGIVGGTLIGRIADLFRRRLKLFVVSAFILTLCDVVWITCMRNDYIYRTNVLLAVSVSLLGLLMLAAVTLSYELTCEIGYPLHEGIIGMCLSIWVNASAVVFLLVKLIPNIGVNWMNWTFIGVLVFGILCLIMTKEKYNRTDVDDTIEVHIDHEASTRSL